MRGMRVKGSDFQTENLRNLTASAESTPLSRLQNGYFESKSVTADKQVPTEPATVDLDGNKFIVTPIDETRVYLHMEPERKGIPLHVGQLPSKEMSDDVYQWLGGVGQLKPSYIRQASKVIATSGIKQMLISDLGLTDADFDQHESDLYVRRTPEVEAWLKDNYKFYSNVTKFKNQIDGQTWLDIPFGRMDDFVADKTKGRETGAGKKVACQEFEAMALALVEMPDLSVKDVADMFNLDIDVVAHILEKILPQASENGTEWLSQAIAEYIKAPLGVQRQASNRWAIVVDNGQVVGEGESEGEAWSEARSVSDQLKDIFVNPQAVEYDTKEFRVTQKGLVNKSDLQRQAAKELSETEREALARIINVSRDRDGDVIFKHSPWFEDASEFHIGSLNAEQVSEMVEDGFDSDEDFLAQVIADGSISESDIPNPYYKVYTHDDARAESEQIYNFLDKDQAFKAAKDWAPDNDFIDVYAIYLDGTEQDVSDEALGVSLPADAYSSKKKAAIYDGYGYRVSVQTRAGESNESYTNILGLLSSADIRYREVRRYTIDPDRVCMDILVRQEDLEVVRELAKAVEAEGAGMRLLFNDAISEAIKPRQIVTPSDKVEQDLPKAVKAGKKQASDEDEDEEAESESALDFEPDEEPTEPEEGDYVITPSGPLGSRLAISQHGIKYLTEVSEFEDADDFIHAQMEKDQFWPSVWFVDDHGGVQPYTLTPSIKEVTK